MTMLRLVLEYDGSDFHGWQAQPSLRTVEGVLRDALRLVTGESPRLSAAGRTDAGAHSHGQVVGVPLTREWEAQRLSGALNAVLPRDVGVRHAEPTRDNFNARFDALSRTYRYVVVSRRERAPLLRRHAWQVSGDLDIAAMRDACALLVGHHDFAAFGRSPREGGSTVRTVERADVRRVAAPVADETPAYVIEVSADAFLYGMMRAIAGALVAVGRGRMRVEDVAAMLDGPTNRATVTVAPARGLHQWRVTYPAPPAAETNA
ncbi:MAG: tRNA pseudouridine(38-40) synthase TruA [Candidatus Dormibacteraeota bacterium]|nr:tRNA pseudouridine(38-40) synthase TruA [Candidatus Dormibacteraeota bacterium]